MICKPHRLEPGMTIGLVSPASAARDPQLIDKGIAHLKKLGFGVKEGRYTRCRLGYLAATDKQRLSDLNSMLRNPRIDAIMCVRGGYGAMRLLDALDYDAARRTPKPIIGFSDITALHMAFWRRCRLVTFHGPMLLSAFAKDEPKAFTVEKMLRILCRPEAGGSLWQGSDDRRYRVVREGRASGRLVGGNLSLIAALMGTPYEIDTRDAIVYLEDVDEKPYRIDRMLTQLLLAGKLRDARAVVFGRNVPDDESAKIEAQRFASGVPRKVEGFPRSPRADYEQIIDDVIADRLGPLGIPVLIGAPFGHIDDYATIPFGVRASLNTRTGDIVIEESAVE
ncbi:MAG: LD-carboxypeptidase [Candidatus Sumerlaeaceae bacterium]|nr:LD-carboxypeptidase [Candidatus Sumerlaeaceae bacterium]